LLCAAEIPVPGAMPLCIRALLHVYTERSREEMHHVYLHGAHALRDDLPD
jgi:chorismate mutase